ncbi:hypothetical protein ACPV3P_05395 [Photobacterium damselae]|uniref:hypothetical protein n=1 Tax=Photobacterium damselae TaxID=38293 RepID=UPI00406944E9
MANTQTQDQEVLNEQRQAYIDQGWRRGAFIDLKQRPDVIEELPKKLIEHVNSLDSAYLFPLLYDCALINANPHAEPWVQCLICWPCEIDKRFIFAKDSRRYHFSLVVHGENQDMEVTALSFCQLEKAILMTSAPVSHIEWPDNRLGVILNWAAHRITQQTFPDEFNRRMNKVKENLKKLSSNAEFNQYCSGIHFKVEPFEEILPEQEYELSIYLTIAEIEGRELREFNKNIAPGIIERFNSITTKLEKVNVSTLNLDTIPEDQFTKAEEREYKLWSLENFTYADEIVAPPLPAHLEFVRN